MFGMGDIMKQAKAMQENMQKAQESLALKSVEGSSGGGMVRVVCTGKQEIQSVVIDQAVVDPADVPMLQDLVTAAVNDALNKARSLVEEEMRSVTGGLNIPGLDLSNFKLPGM